MADQNVVITVTATDNASVTFQNLTTAMKGTTAAATEADGTFARLGQSFAAGLGIG